MRRIIVLLTFMIFININVFATGVDKYCGTWNLIHGKSSEIELYKNLQLNIHQINNRLVIIYKWGNLPYLMDTLVVNLNNNLSKKKITNRIFPTNVFMGLQMVVGTEMEIKYKTDTSNNSTFFIKYMISGSQGQKQIQEIHSFHLFEHNNIMEYRISRSSRPSDADIVYYLKKPGTYEAYYFNLDDDWTISGGLSEKAFLIGLQGLVNREKANLYFIYPKNWEFRFTPDVFNFLKTKRFYTFHLLNSLDEAIEVFHNKIKGYIIWDKTVRTSLMVAFTIAGINDAVIITKKQLPLMKKYNIKLIADLSEKYKGLSDYSIFNSAYKEYGKKCNKNNIVWLGGAGGSIMKPGIADWGVQNKSFFVNLSTLPSDTLEYNLANKILADLKPYSMVLGWHSYKKDKERDYVKLTSHYALRVLGLNTLPNMSFTSKIPVSQGFVFKNHHQFKSGDKIKVKHKIYISFIQTDGLGLGAWNKPGRGDIPYAWEVTMNWYWIAPSMLEYFYSQATDNDYFIGALSGPGYIYPKAVPPTKLPRLISIADNLMHKLDLNVFEIMDYSEGATVTGNTELTLPVVKDYYKYMPDVIGFVNGYTPSYSFYNQNGRPLISYDYYLSPKRKKTEVIADLNELASINAARPYFLLIHVREWSNINRVKDIINNLDKRFEIVPLEIFLKMAGKQPTFKKNLLNDIPR